jgi:release factor glutamine methyltransferase
MVHLAATPLLGAVSKQRRPALSAQDEQEWNVLKLLRWTQQFFKRKNIENGRLDSEVMLGHVLGMRRIDLYARYDQPVGPEELATYKRMIQERVARRPVAYIIGKREFWSMDFEVNEHVLIPRPDTELLVERARMRARERSQWEDPARAAMEAQDQELEAAAQVEASPDAELEVEYIEYEEPEPQPELSPEELEAKMIQAQRELLEAKAQARAKAQSFDVDVLDLGTGSGAVAVALASELPGARVVATDLSGDALGVASRNARNLGYGEQIRFLEGDLFAPVRSAELDQAGFDVIASNPPYISAHEMDGLSPEVVKHEPNMALSPGEDGLAIVRRIAQEAWGMLKPGGWVLCEIGYAQGEDARALFEQADVEWAEVSIVKDSVTRQDRVVEARRPL